VQPVRRAAEVQCLRQRDDGAEIGELDIHNRRLSDSVERFTGRHDGFARR
jgi:hypothetical protein